MHLPIHKPQTTPMCLLTTVSNQGIPFTDIHTPCTYEKYTLCNMGKCKPQYGNTQISTLHDYLPNCQVHTYELALHFRYLCTHMHAYVHICTYTHTYYTHAHIHTGARQSICAHKGTNLLACIRHALTHINIHKKLMYT